MVKKRKLTVKQKKLVFKRIKKDVMKIKKICKEGGLSQKETAYFLRKFKEKLRKKGYL